MQLRSISATNLKGKTFTHELQSGVAIIGPNFSGKTAILQAIVLLLKGYIPQIGKLPKATWELSSGQRMTVRGDFDDGDYLNREFWLEGSVVKSSSTGRIPEMQDIPLLDAEQYFGMTDSERTNYVFSRIKLPDIYTPEAIIAEVEQISFEEEHTEQIQKAKKQHVVTLMLYFNDQTIQAALEASVAGFKDKFTAWNRRSKETQGAVKTLTELKLREKEISTDSLLGLKNQIEIARNELHGLVETKARLTAQREEIARNKTAVGVLQQRLAAERPNYDADIARLNALITELKGKMQPVDEHLSAERKKTRLELSDQIAKLEGSIEHGRELKTKHQEKLASLAKMKCCPTCKAKGKDWKANVEAEVTASLETIDAQLIKADAGLREARTAWGIVDKQVLDDETRTSDNLEIRRLIENAQRDRDQAAAAKATHLERRAELENDLKELQGWVAPTLENGLDEIEKDRVHAAGKLAKLRERQQAALELQQDLKRASQAQLEHLEAAANVAVIKRIQSVLSDRRDSIVADVFNTLLVTANEICGSIFQTPLALRDNTIGRWSHDGKFIPHRVFSGTEKALCYIAIATALSSQAPIRLAILDEFGRLDEDNQADVLANLQKAVTGKIIDQFIVVGTTMPSGDYRNLQVIRMTP